MRAQAPASPHRLHTSDDIRALEIAERHRGVRAAASRRGGLAMSVDDEALDSYVLALGSAGVAVRRLEQVASPVETMFFALTSDAGGEPGEPLELAELDERALAST
jgi:ABC-2 type transport system ATP-binding protein